MALRGRSSAIRATLINDKIPNIQKIVGSSALTNNRPTMDVEVVLETCWIKRSKETMPPRNSAGAFCVSRLFCMGEITPLARP